MRLESACSSTFARHETFHPKFGWFRKAFDAAAIDINVFNDPDATVVLGIGKNMVRSLRFWGTASHLLVEEALDGSRQRVTKPTNVATAILRPWGLDPQMEHIATWWWLHWLLLGPDCHLPVWWITFHELSIVELDEDVLTQACRQIVESSSWDAPNESSIGKDVTALLRTYGNSRSARSFDDQFGCPLRDLNLLTTSPTGGHRLTNDRPHSLPGEIVVLALLDYVAMQTAGRANTVTLSRVATEPGAPGRAFRLGDTDIEDLIAPIADNVEHLTLTAPSGAPQLGWTAPPERIAADIASRLYGADPEELPPLIGPRARASFDDYVLLRLDIVAANRNTLVS